LPNLVETELNAAIHELVHIFERVKRLPKIQAGKQLLELVQGEELLAWHLRFTLADRVHFLVAFSVGLYEFFQDVLARLRESWSQQDLTPKVGMRHEKRRCVELMQVAHQHIVDVPDFELVQSPQVKSCLCLWNEVLSIYFLVKSSLAMWGIKVFILHLYTSTAINLVHKLLLSTPAT